MKKYILLSLLLAGSPAIIFSSGFFIEGGVSVNMSNYGADIDEFISNYFDFFGLNRFVLGGNVAAGIRLMPGFYLAGTFIYTRDMLRGFGYNINLHSPAALAGVRWYPLKSRRFLQLSLDAGPSWLVFTNNIPGIDNRSGMGFGVNAGVAFDFNTGFNEPHWQLAGNVLYSNINGGSVFTPGISVKVGYEKTKNAGLPDDFDMNDMYVTAGVIWPLLGMAAAWIGYSLIPTDNNL